MKPGDIIHLVVRIAPVQAWRVVDIYFFFGKPFYAVGKSESAADTEQCAKAGPHFRVGMGDFGQSVIVMGFRKMD